MAQHEFVHQEADGRVLDGEDLVRAVRTIADGGSWLDPAVTGRVLATYRASATPDAGPQSAGSNPSLPTFQQALAGGTVNAPGGGQTVGRLGMTAGTLRVYDGKTGADLVGRTTVLDGFAGAEQPALLVDHGLAGVLLVVLTACGTGLNASSCRLCRARGLVRASADIAPITRARSDEITGPAARPASMNSEAITTSTSWRWLRMRKARAPYDGPRAPREDGSTTRPLMPANRRVPQGIAMSRPWWNPRSSAQRCSCSWPWLINRCAAHAAS